MNKLSIVKDNFKELPNNIEAEQAILGTILVSNEIFDEINTIISNINFYDPMHQKIFAAIENLIYKGMLANPITLKNYFEKEKDEAFDYVVENHTEELIEYVCENHTKELVESACDYHLDKVISYMKDKIMGEKNDNV